ncbi:hypothetical protein [Microbacterium sp. 18062]|uniref:hypothetical protein n=1 Tax=Microbacterium sp. 18062 TaxID=2681410 RepID=UPI001359C671|nr:hypothetical protein [Microbacterium sp. 18062]
MARIGGRNSAVAWVVGLGCAAVVGVLVVLAIPAIPASVQLMGDTLRAAASAPEAAGTAPSDDVETATPVCRGLYTEALWAALTQRAGGDPVQDTAPPTTSVESLATALAPQVRVTCAFAGTNTGHIVTTVSDVSPDAAAVARATLETNGFGCTGFGDGIRCERATADGVEEQVVRAGVWVSNVFTGWRPDRYLERMGPQLWP